jgi:gamma-glutamyl:cysteine ligase YbdK (ATP-grasp superfamily)
MYRLLGHRSMLTEDVAVTFSPLALHARKCGKMKAFKNLRKLIRSRQAAPVTEKNT